MTGGDARLGWVPRLHPGVAVQSVKGTVWAATGDERLHSLDDEQGKPSEVAARIVALADGKRSVGEIASVLCSEFEVDAERCASETAEFVELLIHRQVLVR